MSLLNIKKMRVSFGSFMPVKGVSLSVECGEFVALVGASGSGKSTVAMNILRLQDNVRIKGQIFFRRKNILCMNDDKLRQLRASKIAMIFQEPMTSLNPLHTAGAQIAEVLKINHLPVSKEIVCALLRQVDLTDTERIYKAYPHELSGGQRQRVMIAMALAGKPDLLIADEPTTALDVSVQAQILDLLKRLQKELKLAILFITHDLDIVRAIADRVYVMQYGKITSTQMPSPMRPWIRHTPYVRGQKPAIEVNGLSVFYQKFQAVKDVHFKVMPSQTVAVVGESGSGKSSLAQGLVRLIAATGTVKINDMDFFALSGKELRTARSNIQMVLQDPASSLNPRMMIADIVGEGLKVQGLKDTLPAVKETLKSVGLSDDIVNRYPHELSGGQRTRVALARALILKPSILVLDEVTSSLDVKTQRQLIRLLTDLQKRFNLAYIFISHDMKAVQALSDYVLVMKDGKVIEQNFASRIFNTPKNDYTKQLLKASFI